MMQQLSILSVSLPHRKTNVQTGTDQISIAFATYNTEYLNIKKQKIQRRTYAIMEDSTDKAIYACKTTAHSMGSINGLRRWSVAKKYPTTT